MSENQEIKGTPIFDVEEMRKRLHDDAVLHQELEQPVGWDRLKTATDVFCAMVSNPYLVTLYHKNAAVQVGGNISAASGEPLSTQGEKIQAIMCVTLIQDAYKWTDQLAAANQYLEPGKQLIIPMMEAPPDSQAEPSNEDRQTPPPENHD